MRRILASLGLTVALLGCGGSGGGGGESSDPSTPATTVTVVTEPVVTEPVVTEPVVTEPVVTEPVVTEPVVTEPPATEPPATEPPVTSPLADVAAMTVTEITPGDRPRFTWEPVDDAVEYSLVVAGEGGGVIWAWRGTETSIDLGAGLIDGNEGPRLAPGSTLDLFALSADGTILAASGPVPLAP
jgi:hypothetical protein